ncbi:armadillo repeat-containing protein 7 [Bradysia coprophila]|uniref:armadillo repeat-containing protein 7 n=1 Tax=Bradysia coprophila TaxID=38358 RepID=UPI00187D7BDF|nr:armadillo repeat-containing protein 7 [Bradysia coprophila]
MYQTQASLKKKAQGGKIDRGEFIYQLTSEFYSTRHPEVQGQTSANLANLSYDPINFDYLQQYCVHDIFLELIITEHTHLILHGIAGLCNLSLDDRFHDFIIANNGISLIKKLLTNQDDSIKINALACLLFLCTRPNSKWMICSASTRALIENLCLSENVCLSNLATYFVTDQFMDNDIVDPPSYPVTSTASSGSLISN